MESVIIIIIMTTTSTIDYFSSILLASFYLIFSTIFWANNGPNSQWRCWGSVNDAVQIWMQTGKLPKRKILTAKLYSTGPGSLLRANFVYMGHSDEFNTEIKIISTHERTFQNNIASAAFGLKTTWMSFTSIVGNLSVQFTKYF